MKLSSQPRDWKQQYFLYNSDIEDGRNTDLLGWDWAVILTLKVHIRLQILITNFFSHRIPGSTGGLAIRHTPPSVPPLYLKCWNCPLSVIISLDFLFERG